MFFVVASVGCARSATSSSAKAAPAPVAANTSSEENSVPLLPVGTPTHCPVTGEAFTVKANTVQLVHNGKRYAFCCSDCKPDFLANPTKFAK